MSLCEAIASSVTKLANGHRVTSVALRIGHFRQVVPDALEFCWGMLTEGTDLAGSTLEMEMVPAVVECSRCGARTTLDMPLMMCGSCDDTEVTLVSGEEFRIDSFDYEPADHEPADHGGEA